MKCLLSDKTIGMPMIPLFCVLTADNFILPKPNTELYKGSLAYSGPVIWNCLNNEVKSAPSTESFHNRCIKWLKA